MCDACHLSVDEYVLVERLYQYFERIFWQHAVKLITEQ